MPFSDSFVAIILGLVEGLTEFLPISSTGHLILVGNGLGATGEKWKVFEVFIQLGAILAVCWAYRVKLWATVAGLFRRSGGAWRFWINLGIAFLPAAVIGLLGHHAIKHYLFNPLVVCTTCILGALVIFWVERRPRPAAVETVEAITPRHALLVGLAQLAALIPGTSRSGATIIGGMIFGLSRQAATEFSFFLAIPVMFAASLFDLYQGRDLLHAADVTPFAIGFGVSFVAALLAVKWLLRFISSHNFVPFAWYRIALGVVVILYWLRGGGW
ncbi:MAG: undecaprenyl-diphosphate phosphatase [Lentisphaeria bacterium]